MLQDIQALLITYQKVLLMVAVAILVDTMTGVAKAIKNDTLSFQSKFLKRVISKLLMYSGCLILCAGIEITFNAVGVLALGCIAEIGIELISIKENVSEIPQLADLIDQISDKLNKDNN